MNRRVVRPSYEDLTAAAWAAVTRGDRIHDTLAEQFSLSLTMTAELINEARLAGFTLPGRNTRPAGIATTRVNTGAIGKHASIRLVCDTCPAGPWDNARDLFAHTAVEHQRPPTRAERTPRR